MRLIHLLTLLALSSYGQSRNVLSNSQYTAQFLNYCGYNRECNVLSLTASAASTATAIQLTTGAKICLTSACLAYVNGSGNDFQIFGGAGSSYQLYSGASGIVIAPSSGYVDVRGPLTNQTASTPVRVEDSEGMRWTGVAYASLAACEATTEGALQYDTTNDVMRLCVNGTGWRELIMVDWTIWSAYLSGVAGLAIFAEIPFASASGRTAISRIRSVVPTVIGVGAGNFGVEIYDANATTVRNTVTIACTAAIGANGGGSSASTPFALGGTLQYRVTNNGCGTLPQFNVTSEISAYSL